MTTVTDIGTLLTQSAGVCDGRLRIAGTGVSVRRIVGLYKLGCTPEETCRRIGPITLAQVYAALTHYHANQEAVEAEFSAEDARYDRLYREHQERRAAGQR